MSGFVTHLAKKDHAAYESKEFSIVGAQTNYNVKTQQTAFAKFSQARAMILRTDQDITFKLNDTASDAISLKATEGSFSLDFVEISNIFITTGGAGANIKLLLG